MSTSIAPVASMFRPEVSGIPILYPYQYQILIDRSADDARFRNTLVILFHTGIRYEELDQIVPGCYDETRGKIVITTKKVKVEKKTRYIKLTPDASRAVKEWIGKKMTPMSRTAYNARIRRMGMRYIRPDISLSAKSSRKTCESWRMALDDDSVKTCKEIGHSPQTAYRHYVQDAFGEEDRVAMKAIFGRN